MKVVDTESATLGWPKETAIPLDGNHRSMCWFTDAEEPTFQLVWTCIESMVTKFRDKCEYLSLHSPIAKLLK